MLHRQTLLSDLQSLLTRLEADLLKRSDSDDLPEVGERLRGEYERAKKAERTAMNYEDWRNDTITQAAAAWVLSCVFVRFLEDNRLIDPPKIAGPGERLRQARDEWELYLGKAKHPNERDYLLSVFDELAPLPGAEGIFGRHNAVRELPGWLSGDGARELLAFFQKIDPESGALVHDFTDPAWETRFLGDLYQDLSEAARKKYALLQTPEFVEEFILDRTLEPAIEEFGLVVGGQSSETDNCQLTTDNCFRMIDPACGSGHFLLGAFARILNRWRKQHPGTPVRELVGRTLNAIHGVDVNPYAVAITRFRLLLAAMRECGVTRLADAPAFHFHLACGDSLLHGEGAPGTFAFDEFNHVYQVEDHEALNRILRPGRYHAVVANPPYITPKDKALNELYRKRYSTCHRQYALTVPFMQRLFQLAVSGYGGATSQGGYVGQITSNSFMKREFGKKIIEQYLAGRDGGPSVDLTHVIDTSGAYIPGHGTPTVILFGRNRAAVVKTIRTVMGIRGEPSTPADPARGLVWSAIVGQIDRPGSQSEFVSVADSPRELFAKHPWSIGGGGAAELKERLEDQSRCILKDVVDSIGRTTAAGEDEAWMLEASPTAQRKNVRGLCVFLVVGDQVRDWRLHDIGLILYPYDHLGGTVLGELPAACLRSLWPLRTNLSQRTIFGKNIKQVAGRWYAHLEHYAKKLATPLAVTFADIATHNHFVLDRGGKVFNRTAPVIKLPPEATEDDHLALLGLLNSSTACFWMKQVCHQKQMMGGDGIRIESKAKVPYAFNATALEKLPVPPAWEDGPLRDRLLRLTREMDQVAKEYERLTGPNVLLRGEINANPIRERWSEANQDRRFVRARQVFLQEQIDFTVYRMFDLVGDDLLGPEKSQSMLDLSEGDRPFCIVAGTNEEGFPVPQEVPLHLGGELADVWKRRIDAIRQSPDLKLIESSFCKRRWIGRQGLFNHQRSKDELRDAAKDWLVNRLESCFDFDGRMNDEGNPTAKGDIALTTVARLADVARQDAEFMVVGEVFRDDPAFDVERLVAELVEVQSVPLLPVLRYRPTGLRKRAEWEKTWELQRLEDCIDARIVRDGKVEMRRDWSIHSDDGREPLSEHPAGLLKKRFVGEIPVPPKYTSADFLTSNYWRLRGKLDVPKERWVSFPQCEGPDGRPVIAWAGYDHLQLARAVSAHYVEVQERLGGRDDPRLVPLLACIIELLPWLKQWHNEVDPEFGMAMGDYFEGFIQDEARQLGKTLPEIKAWEPPARRVGRGRKA